MSTTPLASGALPRPRALTTLVFHDVHEEGFQSAVGRCHDLSTVHPYAFVCREAANLLGNHRALRSLCDGYSLRTPGYRPPPLPDFDDSEIPF